MENSCEFPEKGHVIAKKDDLVLIKIEENNACSSCSITGCASSKNQLKEVWIKNTHSSNIGDTVLIEHSSQKYILSALFVFIIPLLILLLSILITETFFSEKTSLLISCFIVVVYYVIGSKSHLFKTMGSKLSYKIIMTSSDKST